MNSEYSLVSLTQFASIANCSAQEILMLLDSGALPLELGADNRYYVDLSKAELKNFRILQQPEAAIYSELSPLEQEIIASEIQSTIEEILVEALGLATQWANEGETSTSGSAEEKTEQ